jgi:hypothetical protein
MRVVAVEVGEASLDSSPFKALMSLTLCNGATQPIQFDQYAVAITLSAVLVVCQTAIHSWCLCTEFFTEEGGRLLGARGHESVFVPYGLSPVGAEHGKRVRCILVDFIIIGRLARICFSRARKGTGFGPRDHFAKVLGLDHGRSSHEDEVAWTVSRNAHTSLQIQRVS